jgi:hypothetical protein
MIWFLLLLIGVGGAVLLVRALHDVRDQVTQTVDSFTEFRAALAPALVVLQDETRHVAIRLEPAHPGAAHPS